MTIYSCPKCSSVDIQQIGKSCKCRNCRFMGRTKHFGSYLFYYCTEIDIDRDIDFLITGACIEIDETTFYIRKRHP